MLKFGNLILKKKYFSDGLSTRFGNLGFLKKKIIVLSYPANDNLSVYWTLSAKHC